MSASGKPSMVQEKGQVTIPAGIRKKLGLKKGDLVSFVETDEGVLIRPAEVIVSDALDEMGRALKAKGLTLEQLIDRGREIRGKLIEDEYGLTDSKLK
jgi:AbrB family looped-hinge helix DNA binding protein